MLHQVTIARGQMQVVEGGLPDGSSYLLLGSDVEGGALVLIDDAKSLKEAQEKAEHFLEEHPDGGILVTKHICACYRVPLFPERQH
jgi:hypothetical protein